MGQKAVCSEARVTNGEAVTVDLEQVDRLLAKAAKSYTDRRRWWTEAELELVRKYYLRVPTDVLAKALNRSIGSVKCQSQMLGLQRAIRKG